MTYYKSHIRTTWQSIPRIFTATSEEEIFLISGAAGIYLPQEFAEWWEMQNDFHAAIDDETLDDISSPENEYYHDAWNTVLSKTFTLEEDTYYLDYTAGCDLILVPNTADNPGKRNIITEWKRYRATWTVTRKLTQTTADPFDWSACTLIDIDTYDTFTIETCSKDGSSDEVYSLSESDLRDAIKDGWLIIIGYTTERTSLRPIGTDWWRRNI